MRNLQKHSILRKRTITTSAAVYLTAVLEYIVAEILELSGNAAKNMNTSTITPYHIMHAVRSDTAELEFLFGGMIFGSSGVLPNIHPILQEA